MTAHSSPSHSICGEEPQTKGEEPVKQREKMIVDKQVIEKTAKPIDHKRHVRIDGGLTAWSQVVVGHLVAFNAGGYGNSFGIFQAYYTSELGYSPSSVSWIGSIQIFLTLFVGALSGRAMDAGYYRHAAAIGFFLQVFATLMTSFASEYYQFLLAQGICQGLANAIVFTPTVALISTYFSEKRSQAVAGMTSGTATGGVVFPIIARQLFPRIGFAWAVRVMALVMMFNAVLALLLARPIPVQHKSAPVIEFTAFKDPWFSLLGLGLLLALLGQYIGYFYVGLLKSRLATQLTWVQLASFAEDIVHVSSSTGLDLLLVTNIVGLPGRIIPAWFADRYTGPLNMLLILISLTGILTFAWAAVNSISGVWIFAVIYGLIAPGIQGLAAPSLARVKTDPSKFGVRIGMMFSIMSIGILCGPPLAGVLVERDDGKYLYGQVFGGTVMIVGAAVLLAPRLLTTGWSLCTKI